jgi:hypothetical protein
MRTTFVEMGVFKGKAQGTNQNLLYRKRQASFGRIREQLAHLGKTYQQIRWQFRYMKNV